MTSRRITKRGYIVLIAAAALSFWAVRVQTRGELLPVGAKAPDFSAPASDGSTVRLSDVLRQVSVVLVFYPADNTVVCTAQLCALRDSYADLTSLHCSVLGINPASAAKHSDFAKQYHFPFPILYDRGANIAEAYGCAGLFHLNRRTVYIINADGTVRYAQRGNPPVSELLAVLKAAR
jgi:peroxiredoxin Q/BCP